LSADLRAGVWRQDRYGAAVGELMGWGFDKAAVLQALEAAGGDQQAAANILLG
jgi:hypothetical protein